MAADPNRDVQLEIAHVLFTDIVGYSKLPSDEQRELFQVFNEVVRNTRQFRLAEEAGKLVRLATGDGIALAFFTSPDAPVRCAREISRELREHPQLQLRMGINSGPVDQVSDVNDRRNVTGAGINMAQRVMDCGDAGHILLSKRVADDLAQYSEWRPHLHELGDVEVKHGLRVHVVNLYDQDFGNPDVPSKIKRAEQERVTASARAAKLKRRRVMIATSAALLSLLSLALGTWVWQRRVALTSAYRAGAAGIVEKSIAVLPFEIFAEDKENAYFADGVQDDILTDLAKVADLKVISRRSVAQYRGSTKDVREIGQALQVAHVLEGTVRKIGDTIRVTAQLIDTRTEAQTWADKYERKVADVFAIQSDISQAIVAQLKAALSPSEKAAIEERPTQDQEAYDLYLRARALVYEYGGTVKAGQGDTAKATTLLESAIARDPKFTLAYCLLSEAQLNLFALEFWNYDRLPKAKEAMETALRISPNSGQAHLTLAEYLYLAEGDSDRAEKELTIAAAALPGHVDVFNLGAAIAEQRGQWTKALHDREKAAELDPRDQETAANLIALYINILPGLYSLELDYQERFENFSDFGGTERPKFSVRWQPIDSGLTVRATYSEAYHAPTLSDLFRGVQRGFAEFLSDPRSPATGSEVGESFSGNPNLQPETAYEWTYGAIVTPGKWWSPLQGLTLQADFYHIDLRAVTVVLKEQYLVNHEDQFPGQVIRGPSTGPGDPFGPIILLFLPEQNLGRLIEEGWDYQAIYSFDTSRLGHGDWGTLTGTFNATYIDRVELQAVAGGPEQSVVGKFGGGFLGTVAGGSFTHNRWYASLFYDGAAGSRLGGLDTGFTVHYIGQYWDDRFSTPQSRGRKIREWTTLDFIINYTVNFPAPAAQNEVAGYAKDGGKSVKMKDRTGKNTMPVSTAEYNPCGWRAWLNNTTITIGMNNIFDAEAPFVAAADENGYDEQTANIKGRTWYVALKKRF